MKKPKTLFDQAIEIIEAGMFPYGFLFAKREDEQHIFMQEVFRCDINEFMEDNEGGMMSNIPRLYTRLLLARELWNDGQEKYWKQGKFY